MITAGAVGQPEIFKLDGPNSTSLSSERIPRFDSLRWL